MDKTTLNAMKSLANHRIHVVHYGSGLEHAKKITHRKGDDNKENLRYLKQKAISLSPKYHNVLSNFQHGRKTTHNHHKIMFNRARAPIQQH